MIKERMYIYRRLNIFADALIAGLSFMAAMYLRIQLETGCFVMTDHYRRYLWLICVVMILWPLLLNINGLYPANRLRPIERAVRIIITSSLQGLFIVVGFLFLFKLQVVSRLIIAGFSLIVTALLVLKEIIVIAYIRRLRKTGADTRNVLIVGTVDSVREISGIIEKNSYLGLSVAGILVPRDELQSKNTGDCKVLGTLDEIEKVLHGSPIDHVIITIDRKDYKEVDNIVFHSEEEGVEIWLTPNLFNVRIAKLDLDELCGIPVLVLRTTPRFSWPVFIKSLLDRMSGLLFSIMSLPLIAAAAVFIKLTSQGPVFFKQERCSIQGRRFILYKLRTMSADAENMQKELEAKNIMKGPVFKMKDDPRITSVGRILRRLSIDEMPQFWNVLKGDMSLIGPRPPVPEEVKRYDGWQRRRLSMKPGITGLWQISGRSDIIDFDKLAGLDLQYIDNWSLWFDFKIFLKTVWVVLTMKGAK